MNTSPYTDGELLERFLTGGDDTAFARIVQRHSTLVRSTCLRVLRRHQDAEDVTQAVFATLLERAETLIGRASLAGWLYRVAWHQSRRMGRSLSVRCTHEYAAAQQASARSHGVGHDPVVEQEMKFDLYRALSELPDDYREALVLHHLEGHTVQEVARLTDCPVGTAAARLSRGRELLRARLERRLSAADAVVCLATLSAMEWQAVLACSDVADTSTSRYAGGPDGDVAAAGIPPETAAVSASSAGATVKATPFLMVMEGVRRPILGAAFGFKYAAGITVGAAAACALGAGALGVMCSIPLTNGTSTAPVTESIWSDQTSSSRESSFAGWESGSRNPGNSLGPGAASLPEPGALLFPVLAGGLLARRRRRASHSPRG